MRKIIKTLKSYAEYFHLKRIYNRYKPLGSLAGLVSGKNIVFYDIISWHQRLANMHLILALLFKKAGADKIYIIQDDGCFPQSDTLMQSQCRDNKWREINIFNLWWFNMVFRLECRILRLFFKNEVKIIKVSHILKKVKMNDAEIKSCRIEASVISSCRRFFQRTELDYINNPEHRRYYDLSRESAIISSKIGKYIVDKLSPGMVFAIDGVYASTEPVLNYVRRHNVKTFILEDAGYVLGYSLLINDRATMFINRENRLWNRLKSAGLSANEREYIEEYFNNRVNKICYENSLYFPVSEKLELKSKKGRVFCLFPNVIWDANIVERDVVFNDNIEWLAETIKYFISNPQKGELIIRFHPSETTLLKGSLKFEDIIKEYFDAELYKSGNITIIPSSRYVNSYELIRDVADVCIVYDSMIALEGIYLKKPVIACGLGRYRAKGFTFDPVNRSDYFKMLSDPDKIIGELVGKYEEYLKNMYECAYYFLRYSAIPYPALGRDKKGKLISKIFDLSVKDLLDMENHLSGHMEKILG